MNNIDILELLAKKIEEQTSIIASCSSIINKKAEARERTEYIKIKEFVETLIAENKELKEKNEYLKSQIPTDKIFYYSDKAYIPKSKVEEKIEEVEQWGLYNMKIPKLSTLDERLGAKIGIKYVLQSLLGKE